ncbi:hypothetical protein GQ473_01725, partial [archaeon]|nr:hypothetical protein [archaeon]
MYKLHYLIVFMMIFLGVFGGDVHAGCSFLTNEVTTTGSDTNIDATYTEQFNISSNIRWGWCKSCVMNITTVVPDNYLIDNQTTIMCDASNYAIFNNIYVIYEGSYAQEIVCEFITPNDNAIYTAWIYTTFNTTTKPLSFDEKNTEWKMNYALATTTSCNTNPYVDYVSPITSILAPHININNIWITLGSSGYTYIMDVFDFSILAENIEDDTHTGNAFNVSSNITYNDTAFNPVGCNPEIVIHGDVASGSENTSICQFNATQLGTYNFNVFLSDNSSFYNDTEQFTVNVVNLTINGSVGDISFGDDATISATVQGNATLISQIYANITYNEINNDGTIIINSTQIDLTDSLVSCESATKCFYSKNYPPLSSGTYNVTFYVETTNPDKNTTNTTIFNVDYGNGNLTFVGPAQFIFLKNQTFNITANITAQNGDLWGMEVTLNSTDDTILNITNNRTKPLINLKSGTSKEYFWQVYTNNTGVIRLNIDINPKNGTNITKNRYRKIVDLVVDVNETLNITQTANIKIKFAGNLSILNHTSVNISKEFFMNDDYSNYLTNYYDVDASQCYVLDVGSKNIALLSNNATATDSGGFLKTNESRIIDNDDGTQWSGITTINNPVELNITLDNQYDLQKIELLWDDLWEDTPGNSNISIEYLYTLDDETSTEWILIEENINAPNITNTTSIDIVGATTNKFRIVQYANNTALNIYSFRAFTVPLGDTVPKCYVYEYNYTNTTRSGNYGVLPKLVLNDGTQITKSHEQGFFVNYGQPQITFDTDTFLRGNEKEEYSPKIKAIGGDLRNISLNLTIHNQSILNLSSGESIIKTLNFLESDATITLTQINWSVNTTKTG